MKDIVVFGVRNIVKMGLRFCKMKQGKPARTKTLQAITTTPKHTKALKQPIPRRMPHSPAFP